MVNQKIPSLDSESVNKVLEISFEDGITYEKFNKGVLNYKQLFDLNNNRITKSNNNNGSNNNNNGNKCSDNTIKKFMTALDSKSVYDGVGPHGAHWSKSFNNNIIKNLSEAKFNNLFVKYQNQLQKDYVDNLSMSYETWVCHIIMIAPSIPKNLNKLKEDVNLVKIFKDPLSGFKNLDKVFNGVTEVFKDKHNIRYTGNVSAILIIYAFYFFL